VATPSNRIKAKDDASKKASARRHARSAEYQTVGVRIEPQYSRASIYRAPDSGGGRPGRHEAIDTKLVDVSKGGLGVESFTPLPLATLVNVQGELHSLDSCVEFRGTAWVVHCLAREDGVFRIGLNFEKLDCWALDCEHEDGFAIDPYL
jgi:hypothetical protein